MQQYVLGCDNTHAMQQPGDVLALVNAELSGALTRAPRAIVAGVAGYDVMLIDPLNEALPAGSWVVSLTRDISLEVNAWLHDVHHTYTHTSIASSVDPVSAIAIGLAVYVVALQCILAGCRGPAGIRAAGGRKVPARRPHPPSKPLCAAARGLHRGTKTCRHMFIE